MGLELRHVPASGTNIAYLEYEPRRPRGVTLVVGHGYSSSKHNLDFMCGYLASHGFRALSLDFPGHKLGASGGRLNSIADLDDAMLAVAAWGRQTYGDPIYTVGHSMGAGTALRCCAADPRIAGAVSIATGTGRAQALAALRGKVSVDLRSSYVDGLPLEEVAAQTEAILDRTLAGLAGRPVLYIAADRDTMVSRRSAEDLFERAPEPKRFEVIEGDHTYTGEQARGVILAWLNERHPRDLASL